MCKPNTATACDSPSLSYIVQSSVLPIDTERLRETETDREAGRDRLQADRNRQTVKDP